MNLNGITSAAGLYPEDAYLLEELVYVYNKNINRNKKLRAYYEDKVPVKNLGRSVDQRFVKNCNTSVGWAAKGVDLLADRSKFDGFVFSGYEPEGLSDILKRNRFAAKYSRILTSELISGCSFWTVGRGGKGRPQVVINAYNALSAAATWDYYNERVKSGFVIADMGTLTHGGQLVPTKVVMHTSYAEIVLTRTDLNSWDSDYYRHGMGRPMMEAMCNGERDDKHFGKSRITPTVMGIVDAMKRELVYTELQNACYSMPQKYLTGLTDEQFDSMVENKSFYYSTDLMLLTKDNDGQSAQLNMLQSASVEPHISMQNQLANRIAAEFSMPVAAFGVPGNGYTSSDALRASNDDLVVVANRLNEQNGEALCNVGRMVLAIMGDKPINELTEDEENISVHWHDTEMLTASQSADANIKIASVVDGYASTDVFKERVGFDESERIRLNTELNGAAGRAAAMSRLFPKEGE